MYHFLLNILSLDSSAVWCVNLNQVVWHTNENVLTIKILQSTIVIPSPPPPLPLPLYVRSTTANSLRVVKFAKNGLLTSPIPSPFCLPRQPGNEASY